MSESANNTPPPPPAEGSAATPAKSLNVNAKSFEPKAPAVATQAPPPAAAGQQQQVSARPAPGRSPAKPNKNQQQQQPQGPPPPMAMPQMMQAQLTQQAQMMAALGMNPFNMMSPMTPGGMPPMAFQPSPAQLAAMRAGLTTPTAGPASPAVNVGNAALAALKSNAPPKFACVLLAGVTNAGKTTAGRQVVNQLTADGLPWSFFCGADHIKEPAQGTRPNPWDTTKDIFDALSKTIDTCLEKQASNPIKGLLIDKQCRGTEELYYLTALLRSKGLVLSGVIGMELSDPEVCLARGGRSGDDGFREKFKFHKVILARIRDTAKSVGLWQPIDASQSFSNVVARLRSVALGCSAQQPHRQLNSDSYHDHLAPMVNDYATYAAAMTQLFQLVRVPKQGHFPGFVNYHPLSNTVISDRRRQWKDYYVRRKSDGQKFVLLYDGSAMFLIPRHMRCVFKVPIEAWLGVPLLHVGKFVFDGELVKLSKERTKEKFLVNDILCWNDRGSTSNTAARNTWKERHEFLTSKLCGEGSAFFSKCDMVIVHQLSVDIKKAQQLLEPSDYASDGIIIVHTSKREEPVYLWRAPDSLTIDFRLGRQVSPQVTSPAHGPASAPSPTNSSEMTETPSSPSGNTGSEPRERSSSPSSAPVFALEVFDQKAAKYVEFQNATVTVHINKAGAVEGAIAMCSIDQNLLTEGKNPWIFVRTRTDLAVAVYKQVVEDILDDCLVSRQAAYSFLGIESHPVVPGSPSGPTASARPTVAARAGFGSALGDEKPPAAAANKAKHVDATSTTPQANAVELLNQLVSRNDIHVTKDSEQTKPQQRNNNQRGGPKENASTQRRSNNSSAPRNTGADKKQQQQTAAAPEAAEKPNKGSSDAEGDDAENKPHTGKKTTRGRRGGARRRRGSEAAAASAAAEKAAPAATATA